MVDFYSRHIQNSGPFNGKIVDLFFKMVDLFFRIVDLFFEIVDLLFERAVHPNPPGYGPAKPAWAPTLAY